MPRDRLNSLREIQGGTSWPMESLDSNGERRPNGPPSKKSYSVIEMKELDGDGLTGFLQQVEEVHNFLNGMNADIQTIKRVHSDILTSPSTNNLKRKELDELTTKMKQTSNCIRSKLKEIEKVNLKNEKSSDARKRIKTTQHAALLRRFIESMNVFQLAQTDYRERCKGRIKRQLEITGTYLDDEEVENKMEQEDFSVFTRSIITESALAKKALVDIEARHADIIQLEKSIVELHDMFLEMGDLVEKQGEQIDHIETHVINTKEYVEKGVSETTQAVINRNAARRKKICIIAFLLFVVLFVFLIIMYT